MRAAAPAARALRCAPPSRVCLNCRRQIRSFSSSTAPTIPPRAGIAPLASRQLLSVAGPDAAKFLQGLVTANVVGKDGLSRTDGFYAGFLTATGRVLHDLYIYPNTKQLAGVQEENAFLVEVDANHVDSLARFVKRYKLRAKVTVRKVLPDEVNVWQAWDEASSSDLQLASTSANPNILLKDVRTPGFGYRILQSGQHKPEVDLDETTEDAYTIRRYLNGVAEGQDEILRETALPQESNMDYMNGIDFRKGCYIGQELTIRTKHRGVVRKRILPCVIYDKSEPIPTSLQYIPRPVVEAEPQRQQRTWCPGILALDALGSEGGAQGSG
uniref:Iron-sulfur cluster assembly factor IBA57 homolog, mitochondrial n=1 Tax=Bionectria ochroleuca TaxID=29856 RepID=A0A8H7NAW9_BIOOC